MILHNSCLLTLLLLFIFSVKFSSKLSLLCAHFLFKYSICNFLSTLISFMHCMVSFLPYQTIHKSLRRKIGKVSLWLAITCHYVSTVNNLKPQKKQHASSILSNLCKIHSLEKCIMTMLFSKWYMKGKTRKTKITILRS